MENLVVEKGPKDIFVRVISPDGAVMSTTSETFIYNGQATLYTTKESIMYENRNTELCVYWEKEIHTILENTQSNCIVKAIRLELCRWN
ncbi:MAG: hypothetical protein IPJ26_17630 [Bacteroidetes bacterium]|nr:hypothetical protein [Bacteroidota bacterium]